MRTAVLAALLLSACVTDEPDAHQVIAAECGTAPLAPGWSISYDGNQAYLSRADALLIAAWRADVSLYSACVEGGNS